MKNSPSPLMHFLIISGGTFINILIGVFTTPLITRMVEPSEYGKLSIFNLYASIAVMIFCLGLDQAMVRFYYSYDSIAYKRKILKKVLVLPILSWSIFATIFLIMYYKKIVAFEFGKAILIILIFCVFIQILSRISLLLLRLQYHSIGYSFANIINKVCYVILVILSIIVFKKNGLFILALSTTISSLITLCVSVLFERKIWFNKTKSINENFNISNMELVKYGLPFILSMGITTVFQGIDKISLNYFCSYKEIGIYSGAMSLVNIFAVLQSSFNSIWAPMATEHYEKNKNDVSFYQKGNAYITFLMFGMGICLIFAKDLFALFLGEKYRQAAYVLPCLCFNPIMYTISETTVSGINFFKKSHLHIWSALFACITNIIGNTILVPNFGGRGAAISTGLSYIVFFAVRTFFSNKYFYVDFKLYKLSILTIIVFLYAIYNTFVKFNFITVVFFIFCISVLLLLYKEELFGCFQLLKKYIFKFINKQ